MPEAKPKKKEYCPECGVDMEGLDPIGHALDHWPETIPKIPQHKEALRRQKILFDMGKR